MILLEFNYSTSNHLQQIYDGFEKLAQKKIVKLKINYLIKTASPVLKVLVNNKITVIYDASDGFNWINDSLENNLIYFKENLKCDFYFKRSFDTLLLKYNSKDRRILPLGFNYYLNPKGAFINKHYNNSFKSRLKQFVKQQLQKRDLNKKNSALITSDVFEHPPTFNKDNRILFSTRLWHPNETNKELKGIINDQRIEYIVACKKEFGTRFTGGLFNDDYSNKIAKSLILPPEIYIKRNYLNVLKKHNICIASTGMHNSIGWKMGEYIAASRAIVSEKLHFDVPGNFIKNENYLEFNNKDNLLEQIENLLSNQNKTQQIMNNNNNYYLNYLNPEVLILNTLKILNQET